MARHLYVAGVDRWDDLIKDSLQIEAVLTYQIDSARFQVRGNQPSEGDEVIIEDDALGRLFAGIIVKVELADTSPDRTEKVWQVECDDYTAVLDRKLVVETYRNMAADVIFRDIVVKYCPGFTTNGVRNGAPVVEELIFDYKPPSECFKELCDYTGWQWQVTYYKDLQFFNPQELNQPAPIILEPGGYFRNLKHTIDQQGLRNRVYVRGGTMLSDPWTYEVKADGSARAWVLPHKPHDLAVKVGGVAKTVGIEYVDDESTKDFLVNYQEKYVRCSAQTPTPVAGTTLSFTYRYDIDVITMVEDVASQQAIAAVQGGDGVYEHVIVDDSLTTIDAAEAAGYADLREHANPQVRGSFETEVPGWQPGQLVAINLPDRGITSTFLVQKVIITPCTPEKWTYKVEYGGRLLGIADWLQALWKAQQKKKLNETALLHKFYYGAETAKVADEVQGTPRMPPWAVEQGQSFTVKSVLVIRQPIDASFTRNSVAYKSDGIQVAANVPRFEAGKFGQAVMVEEGTTNLLVNPGFETGNFTGWSSTFQNGLDYWVIDSSQRWEGTYSACLPGGGIHRWRGIGQIIINPTVGATYTASVYAKCDGNVTYGCYVRIKKSTDGGSTWTDAVPIISTKSTSWVRLSCSYTVEADVNAICFEIYSSTGNPSGTKVYADGAQFEVKAYPTSYIGGTRSAESLIIPTTGVLNKDEGTIELWINPITVQSYNNFFNMSISTGRFLLFFTGTGIVYWDYGPSNSGLKTGSGIAVAGQWLHIAMRWSATAGSRELFVNGQYVGSKSFIPPDSLPATVSVVNNYGALIDDLRISSRARTDDEIIAAYASGQPLELDEDTTYLVPFNGSLQNELYGLVEGEKTISTIGTQLIMNRGKLRTSVDGQNWTDWQDAEGLNEVPYPGYVEVKSLLNAETAVYNFKKPFVETDTVCGFVVVSA